MMNPFFLGLCFIAAVAIGLAIVPLFLGFSIVDVPYARLISFFRNWLGTL